MTGLRVWLASKIIGSNIGFVANVTIEGTVLSMPSQFVYIKNVTFNSVD